MAKKIKKQTKKRIKYELNGESKTLNEWSKEYGVPRNIIVNRLSQGYYLDEALAEPVKKSQAKKQKNTISIEYNGKVYQSLYSLAEEFGLDKTTVHARYKRGVRGDALVAPPKGKGCNTNNGEKD